MDRIASAIEYRQQLRAELGQLEAIVRPDQLTLIELRAVLDVYRPAAERVQQRPRCHI